MRCVQTMNGLRRNQGDLCMSALRRGSLRCAANQTRPRMGLMQVVSLEDMHVC